VDLEKIEWIFTLIGGFLLTPFFWIVLIPCWCAGDSLNNTNRQVEEYGRMSIGLIIALITLPLAFILFFILAIYDMIEAEASE